MIPFYVFTLAVMLRLGRKVIKIRLADIHHMIVQGSVCLTFRFEPEMAGEPQLLSITLLAIFWAQDFVELADTAKSKDPGVCGLWSQGPLKCMFITAVV